MRRGSTSPAFRTPFPYLWRVQDSPAEKTRAKSKDFRSCRQRLVEPAKKRPALPRIQVIIRLVPAIQGPGPRDRLPAPDPTAWPLGSPKAFPVPRPAALANRF